jgi:hypothetical protein
LNVPDEGAKGFDGVHFVALSANEAQPQILVGIFWEPRLSVSGIVIASIFESVEARIAQRRRAALKGLARDSQRSGSSVRGSVPVTPPMLLSKRCKCQRQEPSRASSTPPSM